MKKLFFAYLSVALINKTVFSQNIGIGTNEPLNKLQVTGSLLVNTPTVATNTAPAVAQNKTMVNGGGITFPDDSTGRIYDPGGPGGNYSANQTSYAYAFPGSNAGFEVIVETMDLGPGDSLFFRESQISTTNLLAVGNGYTTTGKLIFNYFGLYIFFKSNSDANTGAGFSLLFRRLYDNSSSLPDISGSVGTSLFFDAKTGAFRSGSVANKARGAYSTGLGYNPTASGAWSTAIGFAFATGSEATAIGNNTVASGQGSFAVGYSSKATGDHSTALGYSTTASGDYATVTGYQSTATGNYSTAMGYSTDATAYSSTSIGTNTLASGTNSLATGNLSTASGDFSTAMGISASTNGHDNSFCIGGTGTATTCTSPNQFMTRFDNYTFWISASNYAYMLPSSNGWAYTSDWNKKERFEELNGETVLKKISTIPFCSWNFKAEDTRQYRHYGITAQDFYNAFGMDSYGAIGNEERELVN